MSDCIHNFKYDGKDGRYPYVCKKCGKRTRENYYTYPRVAFPEMKYKEPKIERQRCGNCNHGIVTNPGANIPGYACKLMEKLFKREGYENGMNHVDSAYGKCDFWNYPIKEALKELTPPPKQGELNK